jgi:hypothetical protein
MWEDTMAGIVHVGGSANLHRLRLQAEKLISANQQVLDQMCGVLTG